MKTNKELILFYSGSRFILLSILYRFFSEKRIYSIIRMFFLSMGLVVAFLVQVIITSQNMELKRPFRKIFGNFLPKDLGNFLV